MHLRATQLRTLLVGRTNSFRMLNDVHVIDLLPDYALEALDGEETRQVADHIAGCYACRRELEAYQNVVGHLALLGTVAEPTADLKPRLLERIERLDGKREQQTPVMRLPQHLFPVGAFAALALILLLAVSNLFLWQRLNNLEQIRGPLGMRAIALQNTEAASGASAFVVMGADGKNGVLIVDHLQPLEDGYEYQVWLVRDGRNTSGGTFAVDEDGYRGLRFDVPDSLLSYSSVFVTVEPAGGSPQPTGEQVLTGSLFNP